MSEHEDDSPSFVQRYDAMIFSPDAADVYGRSGFFNVGYWDRDTDSQSEASAALIHRISDPLPGAPSRILDVGCGLGGSTAALKTRFRDADVVGINHSERQLGHARALVPDCRFAVMDAVQLGFSDGCFDLMTAVESAFHFSDRTSFLREAVRTLCSDGRLALADIIAPNPALLGHWLSPDAEWATSPESYRARLEAVGLVDIQIEDVTEPCWQGFCRARLRDLETGPLAANLDERQRQGQRAYFHRLATEGIGAYVLVRATKPLSTGRESALDHD